MNKYGTIFEPNFNLKKDKFRNLLVKYYNNPNLEKTKNTETQSIYMAIINTNLLSNKQYIVVTCLRDNNKISTIKSLANLKWSSFQTRLMDSINIISFNHIPSNNDIFNIFLTVVNRSEKITNYSTKKYPIQISVLHDNINLFEYPNTSNLISALETFKTIIIFK